MGLGPVEASRQALRRAGMTIATWTSSRSTRPSPRRCCRAPTTSASTYDKLNVHGGAIALGHPFGMTGARITTTLLNGLQARDGQFGLETMCVGGGQGMADHLRAAQLIAAPLTATP